MSISERIKVLCVDDHPLVRDGIAFALQQQPDMELVGEATNGVEAIAAFRKHRPDVTLMDLQMPEKNGIDATTAIRNGREMAVLPISISAICSRVYLE